ncbi:unnamed protein product [Diabrotica balteata]|uniref:Uncharacterized protein n=1 Tax=Diabrotica balteata TaxID=107213 RepID=A0A9N9T528_DIABA|nr:unnamed protein product [Diabrotica balteata]
MEEDAITGHRPPDELHSENSSKKTNMDDNRTVNNLIVFENRYKPSDKDPFFVYIEHKNKHIVDPYIHPVVQCYICLRYSHLSKQCKSKESRCKKFTDTTHTVETCNENNHYIYCKTNDHTSLSRKCPIYEKQKKIKAIMASENITFREAEQLHNNSSYEKIITYIRFSILNNIINFNSSPTSSNNVPNFTINKLVRKTNHTTTTNKRKATSPPILPHTSV